MAPSPPVASRRAQRRPRPSRLAGLAGLAASTLLSAGAQADPLPLRIDFQAAPGCPGADVFLDEIRWRTTLARRAAPGEEALEVRAQVTRRGAVSTGHLVLGRAPAQITRSIAGQSCDEVVSALALVTALAVDPRASTAPKPPLAGGAPGAQPAPAPADEPPPTAPAPPRPPPPAPPQILADPLPVIPGETEDVAAAPIAPAVAPGWVVGALAAAAFEVAPRALLGGGLFVDRAFAASWSPSLRLSVEALGTGSFAIGPGGASFVRAIARVEGCGFALRPLPWLSFVACLAVEGGALHAEGVLRGSLTSVQQTTIFWLAGGALPRVGVDLGAVALDVHGGPIFPAVRRNFVFENPPYTLQTLPAVTWTVGLGAGGHFP